MKRGANGWRSFLALLMVFAICFSLGVTAYAKSAADFEDIAADAWYYDYVVDVVESNIFGGVDATHFSPDTEMQRGMLVAVLWRMEGSPTGYTNSFADVLSLIHI